uniref:C2 domain-containing protein n=1 Tax=Hyaloperonospora arabidopsidis (strain Emoy2) TaxID=559515 RepID=M4C2P5_HYAAE
MAPVCETDRHQYKLVLRVQRAEALQHSSSQGAYCKLYVGPTVHTDGKYKAARASSKDSTTSTADDMDEIDCNDVRQLHVRRTRTQSQQFHAQTPRETLWDEVFVVPLQRDVDLGRQIVSIRVKSQHVFFCPVIGVCAISLANLCPGERLEQWFPLEKGSKPAGRIRVMVFIALQETKCFQSRRHQPNPDVVAARAASAEADEAVERLVQNQLLRQRERRQKRLDTRSSSRLCDEGNWSMDNEQVDDYGMDFRSNVVERQKMDNRHRREDYETWPPLPSISMPKMLPLIDTPAAVWGNDVPIQTNKHSSGLPSEQSHERVELSTMVEYEQRLDRKLLQVRKEMARLRKLRCQLKQYLSELQMDSDSDDSMDCDEEEEAEMLMSGSSMTMISSASE